MTSAKSRRDNVAWVDVSRGFGIIAVVLWHTAGGIIRTGLPAPTDAPRIVDAWDAYGYRAMPLFFLVSGLFVIGSLRRTDRDFVGNKLRTLLYPYLVWSLLSIMLGTVAGGSSNYGITIADLPRLVYDPILQYWFLYALLAVMLGYQLLYRIRVSPVMIVALAAVAHLVTVLVGVTTIPYVVAQIGLFSVFFAIAAAFGPTIIATVIAASSRILLVPVVLGVVAFIPLLLVVPLPAPIWIPPISSTLATIAFVALAEIVSRTPLGRVFGFLGRLSLQIYVAQIIFASGTRVILVKLGIDAFWVDFLLGSAVGLLGPVVLATLTDRVHFPYLWTWPRRARRSRAAQTTG
jgi:fucose 4-O-acetylase-like acetyltransferase